MKTLFTLLLIVTSYAVIVTYKLFDKPKSTTFDMQEMKNKYEAIIQAKVDSLELFRIDKQRAIAVVDSQLKRYVAVTPKLNENVDFMRLDTIKDSSLTLSRREVAAISYMAIELEAYKKMVDEFPAILEKETKQSYDKGRNAGMKKGALIGAGGVTLIFLGLAIL